MGIKEIREQYPQYEDIPDDALLQGFHKKFYSDMGYDEFLTKAGIAAPKPTKGVDFSKIEKPTLADRLLATMNIPQPVVNVAAGMVPGFLEDAPRIQNVATEDGWRTTGRMLKPVETLLGMKAAQLVSALPKVAKLSALKQNVAAAGAGGAVGGALSEDPITGIISGTLIGGALGGAMTPLANIADEAHRLIATWKAGEHGQVINWLNKVFSDPQQKQQAIKELNQLSALVPGERVTAGLAAVSGKTPIPALKSIEEQARRSVTAAPAFAEADLASEVARRAPLEELATKGRRFFNPNTGRTGLSEAEAMRKQVTDPLYAMANRDMVQMSPELQAVLYGGQAAQPAGRAATSAMQGQANMVAGGRSTAAGISEPGYTPRPFNQFGTLEPEPFMPRNPAQSVAALQRVKDELSKKIDDIAQATDTPTVTLRNQLVDARRLLTNSMKSQSGAYATANQIFKNYSAPQNQAEVAEQLLKSLRSPSGAERASSYLNTLQEAPRTLKRAGQSQFSDVREVMTQDQMRNVVNPVAESLKRQEAYGRLQAPSLPAMKSPAEELLDVIPAIISRPIAIIRKFLGKAGAETDTAAQRLLYEAAADPKKLSQLLSEMPPAARDEIVQWVRANRAGLLGADAGMLTSNILSQPQRATGMLSGE
jgi:hypothetical protein